MLNLSDDWWFLGQAVYWIAWRDDQFRGGGALPAIYPGSNAALKYLANSRFKEIDKGWAAAERELFQALVDLKLVAYGINGKGRRVPIHAGIWVKAQSGDALSPCVVSYGSSGGGDLGCVVQHGRMVWEDVHISRDEVTSIWSKPVNVVESVVADVVEPVVTDPERQKRRTKPEAIADWMRERFPKQPSMNKNEFMRLLKNENLKEIGVFSPRTFDKALSLAYSQK
ncbi:MAG: hypothetical protein AB7F41_09030 [Methylocystis sp.]|uniref:hypothetical protein n=1 Tax=Methylocystis sp. TaxID=1911079 RepID=UPI003D107CEF